MRNLTEQNVTEAVLGYMGPDVNPRLREIMASLTKHLHAFVHEVELTEQEWLAGIQFLTETGHMCNETRQEFILLSDVLGVSILMDAINHRNPKGTTESSVLGPFYVEGSPEVQNGSDICKSPDGPPCLVQGRVTDPDGKPIAGAILDIWQTATNGMYDVQDKEKPKGNLRAKLRTDSDGCYQFKTVKPVSYPIPYDGPVGKLLKALGRHPYRPAHIHFIVSAPGYKPVITQIFAEGDTYIESDAVLGVKDSLVAKFVKVGDGYEVSYNFGLVPA